MGAIRKAEAHLNDFSVVYFCYSHFCMGLITLPVVCLKVSFDESAPSLMGMEGSPWK